MKVLARRDKVASEQLDYVIDWTDWLAEGDSIASQIITVTGTDAVLVCFQNSHDASTSTLWLRNGTAGGTYVVVCQVTTGSTPTRIGERAFELVIR